MAGRVFISCGQRESERSAAQQISELLREFRLDPYLAFRVQSLGDIMAITKELARSDYFLFIDFKRKPSSPQDWEISLFTHQELALAHQLGFEENIIALQEEGAPLEGFLMYVLGNPEKFNDIAELLKKLRKLVTDKRVESTVFTQLSRRWSIKTFIYSCLFRSKRSVATSNMASTDRK